MSLTALFGTQDGASRREPVGAAQTARRPQDKLPGRPGVVRSLSYEEPQRRSPPAEKALCPAIQKLLLRGADLRPLSELPEARPCGRGAARPQPQAGKLPGAPAAPGRAVAQPQRGRPGGPLAPPAPGQQALGDAHPRQTPPGSGPGVVSPRELLRKLRLVRQEQQLQAAARPALAAKFPAGPASAGAGRPSEPWPDGPRGADRPAARPQVSSADTAPVLRAGSG